jgi:hypothetical protein
MFARLPHEDKQFEIYPGYEHGEFDLDIYWECALMTVMLRVRAMHLVALMTGGDR